MSPHNNNKYNNMDGGGEWRLGVVYIHRTFRRLICWISISLLSCGIDTVHKPIGEEAGPLGNEESSIWRRESFGKWLSNIGFTTSSREKPQPHFFRRTFFHFSTILIRMPWHTARSSLTGAHFGTVRHNSRRSLVSHYKLQIHSTKQKSEKRLSSLPLRIQPPANAPLCRRSHGASRRYREGRIHILDFHFSSKRLATRRSSYFLCLISI